MRNLNPIIDQNRLLSSSGRLLFAPTELEIEKWPIILDAKEKIARPYLEHAHRICAHQATEQVKSFVQQRYYVIGLPKTLLPIKYERFLCRRFDTQNIQSIMALFPAFRFPAEETKCPFANTGLDFFGPFYIEDKQSKTEKHLGLIFTCLVMRAFHLKTCPDLNTDTFLNSMHIDGSPAEDAKLFYCTAITEKHWSAPPKSWRRQLRFWTTTIIKEPYLQSKPHGNLTHRTALISVACGSDWFRAPREHSLSF